MESQINLETKGNLRANPLAELLTEISQNKLNGSLRLSNEAQKIAVYFDAGETVFAVSNARQHRLFERLLQAGKLTKEQLVIIPEFTNDLALNDFLQKNDLLEKQEVDQLFPAQILEIIKTALDWRTGEWTFSPLVRIKGDIRFSADTNNILAEYARRLPTEEIAGKFVGSSSSFRLNSPMPTNVNLSPQESFVFSRFENSALTVEEIQHLSGLPEAETYKILYSLWLGGFIIRENWNAAFSERKVAAILSAKLAVKKDDAPVTQQTEKKAKTLPTETEPEEQPEESAAEEKQMPLEKYLEQVEKATNYYEIFALAPDAALAEIKRAYFGFAKRFHPDLFHKEEDADLMRRIQTAFTELAHAYDTLKTESSREMYDFKMRKELAEMKAVQTQETTREEIDAQSQNDQAAENFERGFNLLMEENYEAAVPFLARAAHFDKDNARYHAFYGKALSADNKQRHKAEAEMQTALKLDNQNATYRIILAEFFIQQNLLKRAEGELNRLLAIHPNNKEAKSLLDSLLKK